MLYLCQLNLVIKNVEFVSNSVKIECSNWDGKCIDTLIF